MNLNIMSAIAELSLRSAPTLVEPIRDLLTSACEPLTVKSARDRFSHINGLAKQGHIQVIKGNPGEETVIVSLKDLAAMLEVARTGVTFGEALKFVGFKPVRGLRLVIPEGMRHENELVLAQRAEAAQP
jgi:hypothetical protein